jgi:hypothetical protein
MRRRAPLAIDLDRRCKIRDMQVMPMGCGFPACSLPGGRICPRSGERCRRKLIARSRCGNMPVTTPTAIRLFPYAAARIRAAATADLSRFGVAGGDRSRVERGPNG